MHFSNSKHRRLWNVVTILGGAFVFYIITVGLACAVSDNIQVGRLSWLNSNATLDALDAYVVPARSLARVLGLGKLFEWSEGFWRTVTGAPISIDYGTHSEQVAISDAPKDLIETFKRELPNAEIVSIEKMLGGRKGKQLILWSIRFKQDGKLREALMDTPKKVDMTYDVQAP
jgi:hypothetical protein